jgi:hypothetical protein
MNELNTYHWAQDKIDDVVDGKKHRESLACERRLKQMQRNREKQERRKAEAVKENGK